MRLGALEAGGTKMVCAIGNANGEIYERISIPTETPEITVPKMIEYFKEKDIQALGIGCFGPIDLNRKSETYGYITTTPKLAWKNYNIVGAFADALDIPVGFDTDVNGSALGEATWGITKGLDNSIYIISGDSTPNIDSIIKSYETLNPAIESALVERAAYLPQLECPEAFYQTMKVFF